MNEHHAAKKAARLFRNGRSQAVRIPKEFEFEGDEVEIEKGDDGELIIKPRRKSTLAELLERLPPLGPDDWLDKIDDTDLGPLDEPDLGQ